MLTLASSRPATPFESNRESFFRPHPLLFALSQTRYGKLTLTEPGGEELVFTGTEPGPYASMTVYDRAALDEGVARGEIGFAEGYISGMWDSPDLVELLTFALLNGEPLERILRGRPWQMISPHIRSWLNSNSLRHSRDNIMAHYDLGNDFYALWLDKSMTYSCALFEGDISRTLEEAQEAKHKRILRKCGAKPGDHILDLGCGWGAFAEIAARAGMKVTAVTLSPQQANYAEQRIMRAGLSDLVTIQQRDYREVFGQYDHVVSIGMFEHIGERYWPTFFNTVRERLKPGGNAMIQSITLDDFIYERTRNHTGFVEHYIFPGGWLPSKLRFFDAAGSVGLRCHDVFSFGLDYAHTLANWRKRFEEQRYSIRMLGYDETFIRLWRFYLASSMAAFISRRTDVMQVKLTRA